MSTLATWFGAATHRDEDASAAEAGRDAVSLADINEIELLILRRMKAFALGDHASLFHGAGFDFTGLRDWQPGDRLQSVDWAQSSLTNFSPLIVRDFEQPSTSSVIMVADASASTKVGAYSTPPATTIARALATFGLSAVFFQDTVGLVTFDGRLEHLQGVRPRTGKGQVIRILDAYQGDDAGTTRATEDLRHAESLSATLGGFLRKTSMVPVISDFLWDDVPSVLQELARLNTAHDVFLAVIDAAPAFALPPVGAGWVEAFDIETGRSRVMSRRDVQRQVDAIREWQDDVARAAREYNLDVVRLASDQSQFDIALMEFVIERRLRKR